MKRVFCLILVLISLLVFGSFSLAAEGDNKYANGSDENAYNATYDGDETDIKNEGNQAGGTENTVMPKTGGIPAEVFYAAGVLLIAAAILLSRKKVKAAKN